MAEYQVALEYNLRAPHVIILEAMLTVSPKTQYLNMAVPIIPADTGPVYNDIILHYHKAFKCKYKQSVVVHNSKSQCAYIIEPQRQKTYLRLYASSEDSEQPVHSRSPIRIVTWHKFE